MSRFVGDGSFKDNIFPPYPLNYFSMKIWLIPIPPFLINLCKLLVVNIEVVVRFVYIGGIDDYHCLNFLFISSKNEPG